MIKEERILGLTVRAFRTAGLILIACPQLLRAQSPNIVWQQAQNSDRINTIIFSPDGSTVISGSSDRLINFWQASDGTLIQTLNTGAAQVHESSIEALSISPDASKLCSVSYKTVKLWHLPQNTAQNLSGHTDWVVDCAFSPNGTWLATASFDSSVRIWRASDGALVKTLTHGAQMRACAFSADNSMLISAGGDRTLTFRRTSDWSVVRQLTGHNDTIYALAVSPDGSVVASGSYDNTVKVWNISDGSLRYTVGGNSGPIYAVAFSQDSRTLAFSDSDANTLKLVRVSDGALLKTYNSAVNEVQAIAYSPSDNSAFAYGRIDRTVVFARSSGTSSATASITSPSNGAQFTSPANITINASPSKNDGSITLMEFFQGSTKIGEDRNSPYSFTWSNVRAGTYSLTVRDTDNKGNKTTSGTVTVRVNDPAAPTVQITSPSDGASYSSGSTITINADANAGTGVARVEFFVDGNLVGQDDSSPYSTQFSASAGNYSLVARVTANDGSTATSDTVNISVSDPPPEKSKPSISILSPGNGVRVTSSELTVRGRAGDNVGVAQVLVALNSDDFQTVDGTTDWETTLNLDPGVNIVKAKSIDFSGNESSVMTRTVVLLSQISMSVNGSGRIVPNRNGQFLEVGKRYYSTAVPDLGWVFDGWTGDYEYSKAGFYFTMQPNLSLQANFVPNPFIPVKGVYHGLIRSDPPTSEGAGNITVTVAANGTFSMTINFANSSYGGGGKFNNDGSFSRVIPRSRFFSWNLQLQLHVADDSDQITGSISDGNVTSSISADRALFSPRDNPAPQAGRYTVLLPANTDDPDSPQGSGYATVLINTAGSVSCNGTLADGTPFSCNTTLSKNGTWPLWSWLYGRSGSISGNIAVRDIGDSDMDGTVDWFRPGNSRSPRFSGGFATEIALVGSAYTQPARGAPALNVNLTDNNAAVRLGRGDFSDELQLSATLDSLDRVTVTPLGANNFRMSIASTVGLFTGSFLHPVTGRVTSFRGVIFQKQNIGAGFFLGTDQSGYILLQPE